VYAEDARRLIRHLDKRYDFIVHDTFTGCSVPAHVLSVEVMRRLKELLLPGGILAVNIVGAETGPLSKSAQAVNRTVRTVFEHVRAFRDGPDSGAELSNLVFFAATEPIRFRATDAFESVGCRDMLTSFESWEVLETVDLSAPIVTDAHNPLERLALPVSEAFRNAMNQLYPPSFWIQ
jgi:hypothetical protein